MKTNKNITELVNSFKLGDISKFDTLYSETYMNLYVCIMHFTKDESALRNILQNSYRHIYKYIHDLNNSSDFLNWAISISIANALEYLKHIDNSFTSSQADNTNNASNPIPHIAENTLLFPEKILNDTNKLDSIRCAIDSMTDIQKSCAIGFYYSECQPDELADKLSITTDSVQLNLELFKFAVKDSLGRIKKKNGIKLLPFSTFMTLFFRKEIEVYTTDVVIPKFEPEDRPLPNTSSLTDTITSNLRSSINIIKTFIPRLFKFKKLGIVACIIIVIGIIGTIFAVKHNPQNVASNTITAGEDSNSESDEEIVRERNQLDISIDLDNLIDSTMIYNEPLTNISMDWIHEQLENRFDDFISDEPNIESRYKYYLDTDEEVILTKNDPRPDNAVTDEIEAHDTNNSWKYARKCTYHKGTTDNDIIKNNYEVQYDIFDSEEQWIISGTYSENLEKLSGKEYQCVVLQDSTQYFEWDKFDDNNERIYIRYNILNGLPKEQIQNGILCQNIKQYLDSLYVGLYNLTLEYDTVYFENGHVLHSDNELWCIELDNSGNSTSSIKQVILRSNHDNQPNLNNSDIFMIEYATDDIYTNLNEVLNADSEQTTDSSNNTVNATEDTESSDI